MKSSTLRAATVPAALSLALLLAACGGDQKTTDSAASSEGAAGASSGAGAKLTGSVSVDGSSTVYPLTEAAADLYREVQGDVKVTVGTSGTGGGFKKFCAGELDISDASRPIKDEEKAACTAKNVTYREFSVALDALTVVVNKENTWAECLTTKQLAAIWGPDSKVKSWNEVDPTFPNEPLPLFGPGTDSGTFDYFTAEINGEEGASRTDYTPSEDDNVIVQGVQGAKGALGYFGYTYFEENQDKLKAVKIDGGSGCVAPSKEAAQDGTYTPLSRPLFIYPSASALKRPEVLNFVEYYVENNEKIATEAQFIPLNAEQEAKLKTALEELKTAAGS